MVMCKVERCIKCNVPLAHTKESSLRAYGEKDKCIQCLATEGDFKYQIRVGEINKERDGKLVMFVLLEECDIGGGIGSEVKGLYDSIIKVSDTIAELEKTTIGSHWYEVKDCIVNEQTKDEYNV